MFKIYHVITGLDTGGAETMLYKLLTRMDRNTFENTVISLTDIGPIGRKLVAAGIPVHSLGMRKRPTDLVKIGRLVRRFHRDRPNVVQTWLYHADLVGGLAARIAGTGSKVVWNLRQSNLQRAVNARMTLGMVRAGAGLSRWIPDKIICCANAVRDVHQRIGYKADKLVVILNGFELDRFRPDPQARLSVRAELGIPSRIPVVGLIGRFDPQKDHQNFVRAAASITDARPDTHFVLAGEGVTCENTQLASWIKTTTYSGQFHLLGSRDDVPRILAAIDVVVSASLGEGFSNAIGEGMACGIPCVVTDVGDSAEIIGEAGRVVSASDARALATACLYILDLDKAERVALGQRGRKRIESHFRLDKAVQQYEALYKGLLSGA